MFNKTEFYENYKAADYTIGTLYLICFAFGVPANILSLCFFLKLKERLRGVYLLKYLYILTALQDSIISLLSLNHGVTLLRLRDVWLPELCPIQHTLFRMSQRMSVFLVAALSISRTYILLFPLRRVSTRIVLILLAVVWVLMTCFFVLPPLSGLVQITYHWEAGYCWDGPIPENPASKTWDELDNTMDTIALAFPIIPIAVSCMISTFKILASRKKKIGLTEISPSNEEAVQKRNNQITSTIILVTILYIISNLPLFINYVLYLITITSLEYPGPIYSSPFMYFYSWNITELLSTGLNASANPILYWFRFNRFRRWIKRKPIVLISNKLEPSDPGTRDKASVAVQGKSGTSGPNKSYVLPNSGIKSTPI